MTCPECEQGQLYVDTTATDNVNTERYRKLICDNPDCAVVLYTTEHELTDSHENFKRTFRKGEPKPWNKS